MFVRIGDIPLLLALLAGIAIVYAIADFLRVDSNDVGAAALWVVGILFWLYLWRRDGTMPFKVPIMIGVACLSVLWITSIVLGAMEG